MLDAVYFFPSPPVPMAIKTAIAIIHQYLPTVSKGATHLQKDTQHLLLQK